MMTKYIVANRALWYFYQIIENIIPVNEYSTICFEKYLPIWKKTHTPNGRMVIYKTHCKNVSKLTFDIIIKLFDYKTYTWTICVNIITARNFSDKIWCFPIGSKLYVWHLNGSLFLSATSRPYTDHVNHWPLHIASVFDYSCRCPVTTQIQVICYNWHKFLPLGHLLMKLQFLNEIDWFFLK